MESKILGIPFVVWFFILALGLIIGAPAYFYHHEEMKVLRHTDSEVQMFVSPKASSISATAAPTPTIAPTATPSAKVLLPLRKVTPLAK